MSGSFRPLAAADDDTELDPLAREDAAPMTPWIGRVIDDRYRIDAHLADGGMGAVFVARHLALDKDVAFKVIHPRFAGDGDLAERFAREAMATGKLEHPHVASALDYGTLPEGGAYLVMQLVRGPSLQDVAENEGRLDWPRVCGIGAQVADALAAAHAAGIVHRDLKPENVLLEPRDDGSELVKVLDFGIARMPDEPAEPSAVPRRSLTRRGTVMGTPGYMAPEQALGESTDHRADLYALGILLWESIAGRPLFEGDSLTDIVSKQLADEPPPRLMDEARDPTLPPELQELVDHLLQHRPEERPDSAAMVRDQLRDLALQAAVSGDPRGPTPPAGSFAVRRPDPSTAPTLPVSAVKGGSGERSTRPLLLGGIASLLILLAVGGALLWLRDDTPEEVAPSPELLQQLREEAQAATQAEELARQTELLLHEPNRDTRRAAALYVMDFEPADQVPAWVRAVAQLEGAQGCQPIERALAEIRELGDARTRDPVERYYRRTRRRRLRRFYRCVHRDLRQTLEALPEAPDEGAAEGEAAEAEPSG
ncbi:MAG TPA: serine/threonine-protein kinase [Polyangiaceae bacterium LLY-WYZ-15_(1-7)]|nr:hypothetical protein [Myxococcales bacterium]MAT28493.1 hypothetical protein [Sandaracinus sp.]HJL04170.1 serine/threonine-protein kinase [Polyangiaceae bacterium LLY-WYZ-15_(1-7)]MBJ71840.1 hypothetical protein [Sandaracinus sp.]HJL10408.1 serine/threonine-protein kinase [Polyangiaceae bacterium LLY-WYZ-15_(1-7)]